MGKKLEFTLVFIFVLAVMAGIISVFSHSQQPVSKTTDTAAGAMSIQSPIKPEAYQHDLATALTVFQKAYTTKQTEASRKAIIDDAKIALLSLRVPAQYKDLHLGLILALTHLQSGYASDPPATDKVSTGTILFNEAIHGLDWLSGLELAN
ncbi:hypothetical protein COV04_02915 [Candidatus Uhrbacteria bacterium CG10_big_fil_rev_8_21_14_0_10_48_11]|uniref:Uncharacterized protein n=1 Tax=Candidatus Uhrbacteria bacterium CG10_big_fil_rev_8_21_14_0_10_48_11 TaxID=1975037 RepID=A0A2M8LEJ1_9BACT|nr:MAG: hypothetical protein COV04_02915 [Candidatus Uhrbacteria bacterium CG10_big_fil_rev_8_21_14_0_10_48_11]